MIAPVLHLHPGTGLHRRRPAELAAEDHQRLVEQAARLQIIQQRRDRAVHLVGQLLVDHDVVVVVPRLAVAEVELHDADATLHQAPRQQAPAAEVGIAVTAADGVGFLREIERFRRFGLHAEGDFHRCHRRFELRIAPRAARRASG